jgi:2,3-bisphosphoglycerate-independent phosphoglycerate mutase
MVVLDGLGDLPIPELGERTPLEYANKPNLTKISSRSISGLLNPISPGVPPSSDTAHMSIFGYDLSTEYPGRGPFEAAGHDLEMVHGQVAFRFNYATVRREGDHLQVVDRRAGRINEPDTKLLTEHLTSINRVEDVAVKLHLTLEHRGVLILDGKGLSHQVTDTDPHQDNAPLLECQPWACASPREKAEKTARIINDVSREVYRCLSVHPINRTREAQGKLPANAIIVRGAGVKTSIPRFEEKWGLKAACIAAGPLYRGIGRELGMDLFSVEGANGLTNSNFRGKVIKALQILPEYDFIFVHMKAPDVASHSKNFRDKVKVIEAIDQSFDAFAKSELTHENYLVITSDHSTPCKLGMHSGDPVPVLIAGPNIRRDHIAEFGERSASAGGLGRLRGPDVMPIILNLLERTVEFGTRPAPRELIYIPKGLKALKLWGERSQ